MIRFLSFENLIIVIINKGGKMFKKIIVSLFFIFGLTSITILAQVIKTDSLALVELFDSTDGHNWNDTTNWNHGPVGTWYGVTVSGGRVTQLHLAGNNLNGTIPKSFWNLTGLTHVNFYYNEISGSIPEEIENLTSLTSLNFSYNQLTGSIPPEVSTLENLWYLDLAANQLTDTIPPSIGNLTYLNFLILFSNQLTGEIPSKISDLTGLIVLLLSENQFSGPIPSAIWNLTNLLHLHLDDNQFTGSIPEEIENLTDLLELRLNNNQLTGSIPAEIGNLSQLRRLYLNHNQLEGTIPHNIFNLHNLEWFQFDNNMLTGSIPEDINDLINLSGVFINNNDFSDLACLEKLSSLENLRIQNNKFTFEDIEPNIGIPGTEFIYSPQDSVGESQDTTINLGSSLTISVSVGGTNNQYQWKKDEVIIPGATSSSYTISSADFDDSGSYNCEITNTFATELTLYSRPVNVTVVAYITVTSPNGGEDWEAETEHDITWTSNGTSGNVHIEYSTSTGSDWSDVIASTTDDGTHPWTVPNEPSGNCLVRITDTEGDPADVSDVLFTISPVQSITVTGPNGGEEWYTGSNHDITWTSTGTIDSVKIEYSTNNGSDWSDVIASVPDTGAYLWTIPDTPSDNCLVRVIDTDGNPSDTSDAVFTISYVPYITVTSPNGGEDFQIDSVHNVTWNSSGTSGGLLIQYSADNGSSWSDVIASIPDTGVYPWTIPDIPSDSCLLRIADTNGSLADTSNAIFAISPIPFITVISPNGGEDWEAETEHDITWTSIGTSGGVLIQYSTDNGSSWLDVISSIPDTGAYSWIIPDTPSNSCLLLVADTNGSAADTSNAIFTISPIPFITVTSPNGGEDWEAETAHDIIWISTGTSGGVKIEYSTDNGSSWLDVITSIPDTGAYSWTIPDTPSDNCLVRITDTTGSPSDTNDAVFTISPSSAVPSAKLPEVYSFNVKGITVGNLLEIRYALPEKAEFILEVYDIKGTKIKEISEERTAGFYSSKIDMSGKPAGVYFVRMEANKKKFAKTNKAVLVK
jgi:Leucine-rich repeat (LRR) protein